MWVRLAGVREETDALHWNIRPCLAVSDRAHFAVSLQGGTAEMRYDARGADLLLRGRGIGRVEGTARLLTDRDGRPRSLLGIGSLPQIIRLMRPGESLRELRLDPNDQLQLKR